MINVREAQVRDVAAIRDIFRACYGDNYPYLQFYDPERLTRIVYNDSQLLLVAEDTETGRTVGTASVMLEIGAFSDLVGEFGRLAVFPDARQAGIGRQLMAARLERVRHRLHVGLVDARIAHPFSCRIAEAHGFAPVGLLPLKMRLRERESTCLLAQYFGEALSLRRNHPRVIPEVYPLAQLALEHCGLRCDTVVDEDSSAYHGGEGLAAHEMTTDGYATLLRIERGRVRHREIFGPLRLHYGLFKLHAEHSHYLLATDHDRIVGAVGWHEDTMDRTIRIFELIALADGVARFLLTALEKKCRDDGQVSVAEVDVSAYAPQMQRTLLELGFLPAAYVPAMVFSEVERLDIVKMIKLFVPPQFAAVELSPRGQAVADVVLKPFQSQRVLPEIERAMGDLPLFSGLDPEQVRRVAGVCQVAAFEAGQRILEEGAIDSTFYIVLRGEVEIRRSGSSQAVGVVRSGECLGEISLLTAHAHTASAVATRSTQAAVLSHEELTDLIRFRPDIGLTIYRNLAIGLGAKLSRAPVS